MNKKLKKAICCALAVFTSLSAVITVGCDDLGDYVYEPGESHQHPTAEEQYKAYYETYGTVKTLYEGGSAEYDVKKSLYNPNTKKDFSWDEENGEVPVAVHDYVYIQIPILKDVKIDSLALFFKATHYKGYSSFDHSIYEDFPDLESYSSTVYFFLYSPEEVNAGKTPKFTRTFLSPKTEKVISRDIEGNILYEEDGVTPKYDEQVIEYDDPTPEYAVGNVRIEYKKDVWNSFLIDDWRQDFVDVDNLVVRAGSVLYIRFQNNTGSAIAAVTQSFFTFTDLLIRVVE